MQNKAILIPGVSNVDAIALKRAVWFYFFLIIFEGALRKWVVPGLATPLLVVRDPIALWLIYQLYNKGLLPSSIYLKGMAWLGVIGILTAMIFGHHNLIVAIFGARIYLIHFTLIFAIGKVFDRDDVLELGRILLWISIPMALLIGVQFYSPQSAFVNIGVGGDESGGGFSGAMGYFRPPGTFSFTNGVHLFFGLVGCFVFYFLLAGKKENKIMLIGASIGLLAAIPFSISRSLTFTLAAVAVFVMFTALRKPENLLKMIFTIIGLVALVAVLSQMSVFATAIEAFLARFSNAADSEGGLEGTLGDRYFGGMIASLLRSTRQPFFGYGIGMGTNVGSMLLTGGLTYLIDEGEWGRILGEMGAIMGLAMIYLRIGLSFQLLNLSYKKMVTGDILPWVILGYTLTILPQGQWSQPTSLGFTVLSAGLVFASLRNRVLPREIPIDTNIKESQL